MMFGISSAYGSQLKAVAMVTESKGTKINKSSTIRVVAVLVNKELTVAFRDITAITSFDRALVAGANDAIDEMFLRGDIVFINKDMDVYVIQEAIGEYSELQLIGSDLKFWAYSADVKKTINKHNKK